MCNDKEKSYEKSMERFSIFSWISDDSHISECYTDQRYNSEQVSRYSDNISNSSPSSFETKWYKYTKKKIDKDSCKIKPSNYT